MLKTLAFLNLCLIPAISASCSWRSQQPTPCDCLTKCGLAALPFYPPFMPPPSLPDGYGPCSGRFPDYYVDKGRVVGFPTMPFIGPPPPPAPFVGPAPIPPVIGGGYSSWKAGMGKLSHPLVLPLLHGNFSSEGGEKLEMHPSVVLVIDEKSSSNERRFILVDTGLSILKHTIIAGLLSHKVEPSMIDTIVITHTDTDTMGNLNLFPCAEVFSSNRIAKENYFLQQSTPTFDGNRSDLPFHKLYDNTELYLTPGYGLQDHSLIVSKLILNETDLSETNMAIRQFGMDDPEQRKLWQATRREIVCLADYIIPGHGMPFKVSEELKRLAACPKKRLEHTAQTPLSGTLRAEKRRKWRNYESRSNN
ncbi:metallo-beta-lactamase domain-containing protein 1 [Ditylenchus destructor]|uniref:Metallo-beta-lactamase domain-containing protein 1 n=1 Tax=Ditylenchus destructor TaxID=166010 RepID=A0AAD4NCT6_9BILA|nr:metallo-beta-lactamase domain-containing protein 1 [Ditylenchus destructor]